MRQLERDERVPRCVLSEVHCRNRPLLPLRATTYGGEEERHTVEYIEEDRETQI